MEQRSDERRPETNALPYVSCFWCDKRHRGAHPLSVCAPCAARLSMMLDGEAWPLSAPRPLAPR